MRVRKGATLWKVERHVATRAFETDLPDSHTVRSVEWLWGERGEVS